MAIFHHFLSFFKLLFSQARWELPNFDFILLEPNNTSRVSENFLSTENSCITPRRKNLRIFEIRLRKKIRQSKMRMFHLSCNIKFFLKGHSVDGRSVNKISIWLFFCINPANQNCSRKFRSLRQHFQYSDRNFLLFFSKKLFFENFCIQNAFEKMKNENFFAKIFWKKKTIFFFFFQKIDKKIFVFFAQKNCSECTDVRKSYNNSNCKIAEKAIFQVVRVFS